MFWFLEEKKLFLRTTDVFAVLIPETVTIDEDYLWISAIWRLLLINFYRVCGTVIFTDLSWPIWSPKKLEVAGRCWMMLWFRGIVRSWLRSAISLVQIIWFELTFLGYSFSVIVLLSPVLTVWSVETQFDRVLPFRLNNFWGAFLVDERPYRWFTFGTMFLWLTAVSIFLC